jgi:hypothetical protein
VPPQNNTSTPDVRTVLADDNFKQLPLNEKNKVLMRIDPNFAGLAAQERQKVLMRIQYPDALPAPPSTGATVAREGALGLASGASGLPETEHPVTDTAKGFMSKPSPWELVDPTAGGLSAVVGMGKNLYRAGKDIYQGARKGDLGQTAHGVGSLAGQAGQIALAAKGGPKAAAADIGESEFLHPVMNTVQGGAEAAGTEDVFRASVPGAGSKDFNLRDNVNVAKADLAEIQRKTPLTGKGGIVRPDLRLRNAATNIDSYLQDEIWRKQVQPQIDRWAKAQVDLKPLKQRMLSTITQTDIESNPAGVRAIQRWVERMPDNDTLAGLAERRKTINAYLRDFESKSGSDQAAITKTKPLVEALKAQDKAIQEQMFAELRRRGEPGIDGLERRYAALSDLRDAARSQMNQAEAFRLLNRIGFYLNPKNLLGMHERLTATPSAGRLMQRGMKRLAGTELEPPPRPTQGPAPQTPANRMLPAVGETGEGGPHPALGTRAPGGPATKLPPVRVGESGGARSEFRGREPNLGVSSTRETPGKLAHTPGGKYRTPDVNVIKGGTATPEVRLRSNQPASSLPLADKWAEWRSKAQGIVDDPLASQADKVAARQTIKLLARTTRTGPAQPEVEPHLAELVRDGKLSHGEIMRMSRTGVLGEGAAARIFRLARGKGIPPPPAATTP